MEAEPMLTVKPVSYTHLDVYKRQAESHYPTMDIAAIKALPVGELADKDCALFLWITFPMLREALSLIHI